MHGPGKVKIRQKIWDLYSIIAWPHSITSELRFCAVSNTAGGVSAMMIRTTDNYLGWKCGLT